MGIRLLIGDIVAGFPSAAEGYEDEPLNLHAWLVPRPAATFFYRVRGELGELGIRDGAVLVVDRSLTPAPGRLVLTEEDGVFAVRRLERGREPVAVCGVVTAAVMRL